MAAQFEKVLNMMGFDKDAHPRWQMVPVGKDRYMALRDGAGLTVTSTNPAVLTVHEITQAHIPSGGAMMTLHHGDRIFKLHGASKGSAKLQAKNGATTAVELGVDTKNKKTVRLTFNFVKDSAGHHTHRAPASAGHWVGVINYIYNGQANIFASLRHTRHVRVSSNLGATVMWTAGAGSEWNTVTALGDSGADMNYFMVWDYEQDTDASTDTDAGTLGRNCIFEDHAGRAIEVSMAHEMGHHLGRDDHYIAARKKDLMYGYTD